MTVGAPAPVVAVYALARMAECSDPDSFTSPGARWLVSTAESALEAWTWARDHDELGEVDAANDRWWLDWADEARCEVADQAVPIGTHSMWSVFTDLAAWQVDTSDYGTGDTDDPMGRGAAVALYVIADTLAMALWAGWAEELEEERADLSTEDEL